MGKDDLTFDERDSARFMPKSRVIDPAFTWGRERAPSVPWDRTIMYETHVRGYTMLHPAVPEHLRGTFAGLGRKEVVDYIRTLGVTSVELLPIHTFVNDSHLLDKGLTNYWGYNSIGFFAPDPRYSAVPGLRLLRIQGDGRPPARRRAWRSFWMWCTTTPRRATKTARRCRSAASTTCPITG